MEAWNGRAPRAAPLLVAAVLAFGPPSAPLRAASPAPVPSRAAPAAEAPSARLLTVSAALPVRSVVLRPPASAAADPGRSHARTRPRGVPEGVYTALVVAASALTLGVGFRVARGTAAGPR